MAQDTNPGGNRKRCNIRQRGNSLPVRVYAGVDPVTRRQSYLTEAIKGTDKAAYKRAQKVMARLQAQVDQQNSPESSLTLAYAIDEWLKNTDIESTTRHGYLGYINRTIKPVLGDMPVGKVTARTLETFYGELRRCRTRCDGRPFIEHKVSGKHDCQAMKCKPHKCNGMPVRASA